MAFRTKLDFSSNRQVLQYPETITVLSGATSFGVPFSALTVGPDPDYSGVSLTQLNLISTFSGNTGTTVYTWFDSRMQLGASVLSAWTSTNSGLTQDTGNIFTAETTTIIDNNLVALSYSGVNFDLSVVGMVDLGGGAYSGTVYTAQFDILSADTLDFTGRTIWVDVSGITRTDSLIVNTTGATFLNIGSSPSSGALYYTSGGVLTTNTSDKRLKINIEPIGNALSKVLALNGVYYNWQEDPNGDRRIGFLAQDVGEVIPELVFVNKKSPEQYMGLHYDNLTALLVEAIKEMNSGITITTQTVLQTQTVVAEDNNIELNFNGSHESSIGGGLILKKGIGDDADTQLITNENGDWITNNNFIPQGLVIPLYTPESSKNNNFGLVAYDDDFLYVKTSTGWKNIKLTNLDGIDK